MPFCRTLTWVRGLKRQKSYPKAYRKSRTLTWVRGLKHRRNERIGKGVCRTLTWVRGLKHFMWLVMLAILVAPLHGCVD